MFGALSVCRSRYVAGVFSAVGMLLLSCCGSLQDSGDVSTHPSLRTYPNPNLSPSQILNLTQERAGASPETWIMCNHDGIANCSLVSCREIEHSHLHSQNASSYHSVWAYISVLQFRAVFFVCSVVVLAFIVLYCRRLGLGRMGKAYWTSKTAAVSNKESLPV